MRCAVAIPLLSGPFLLGLLLAPAPCRAGEPRSLFGGRLSLGGEASGAYGTDDRGYFNNTDYGTNNLRLFRLDLAAEFRAGAHIGAVADMRTDNLNAPPRLRALPARAPVARPLLRSPGRADPTVFGAFPRRRYLLDNPLIGTPLAYQYLTSLRADAVPRNADELAARRGLGWLVPYPDAPDPPRPGPAPRQRRALGHRGAGACGIGPGPGRPVRHAGHALPTPVPRRQLGQAGLGSRRVEAGPGAHRRSVRRDRPLPAEQRHRHAPPGSRSRLRPEGRGSGLRVGARLLDRPRGSGLERLGGAG